MAGRFKRIWKRFRGGQWRKSLLGDLVIRLVKEKPLGLIGAIIVLVLLFVGVFADILAPFGFNKIHLRDTFDPPTIKYLLGTDNMGRDLLSRIIFGARISMYVGLGASIIAALFATVIGLVSGYFGGKIDLVVQRFVDAWMSFPPMFIILAVMAILGPGLIQVIVVLGVLYGIGSSRIVRSAVIGVKENAYVEAARSVGIRKIWILVRHILPNVTAPIIVLFTLVMGASIIAEASISFLGFGIPPPTPSWGGMLSGSGRQFMLTAPWMALWPGLALAIVVFGINMLGDAVRDILDPRLRGSSGRYGGVVQEDERKKKKFRSLRFALNGNDKNN
jgi:peptide/nickel transport system permease protein